jgi:hypothetical protein
MSRISTDYSRGKTGKVIHSKDEPVKKILLPEIESTYEVDDLSIRQCKDCSVELPDNFEEWKSLCWDCYEEKRRDKEDRGKVIDPAKRSGTINKRWGERNLLERSPERRSCLDCQTLFRATESWKKRCLSCYLRSKSQ